MRELFIARRLLCQLSTIPSISGSLDNGILVVTDTSIGFRRSINLSELVAPESASFQSEVIYSCARDLIRQHRQFTADTRELNNLTT